MGRPIATTTHVDRDGLLEFVRPRHHVVLTTHRADGGVQSSPVTAGVDWDEYRQAMVDQGKCLVRLAPERWGPIATGGFPPEVADGD